MPTYTGPVTVWTYWSSNTATSFSNMGTAATGTADAFRYWTQQNSSATTSFASGSNVWNEWATGTASSSISQQYPQRYYDPYANETDEERIARLERQAVVREQQLRKERRRRIRSDLAVIRAQRLLHSVLSDEQLTEFERTKAFTLTVIDSRTGAERRFRINQGKAGNVTEIDEKGQPLAKYCVHLYGREPMEDTLVAQKLLLETDVEEFERLANVTRIRPRTAA
jgi:hypothetical protein